MDQPTEKVFQDLDLEITEDFSKLETKLLKIVNQKGTRNQNRNRNQN